MSENPARPERLEPVLPTFRHSLRPNASTWLSDHLRHRLALFGFVLRVVLHCGQNSRDRLAEHQVAILARPFVRVLDALPPHPGTVARRSARTARTSAAS